MKEILEKVEMYYERMLNCVSTSGKKNNGYQILEIMQEEPRVRDYWSYDGNRRAWNDRFCKIKEYCATMAENDYCGCEVKMRTFKNGREPVPMVFLPNCGANVVKEEAVYLFKFYDENHLIFTKIGTSASNVVVRLRDEIGDYIFKSGFDIRKVEVCRIVSCGDYPAEGAESMLRAEFIRQYPKAFRTKDRFFGIDIDPSAFDKVLNNYLSF